MKKGFVCLFLYCLGAIAAFAENGDVVLQTRIDWETGRLILLMSTPLELADTLFPQARRKAEERIEAARSRLFIEALSGVTLNSSATAGQLLAEPSPERPAFVAALPALEERGMKTVSVVSTDFRTLSVTLEYSFYGAGGLITPLVVHERPRPLPPSTGYYPTRKYTGLVIDARGARLAFGTGENRPCSPALLPRLFSLSARRTLEPLLDFSMADPEALKKWGLVAYVRSPEAAAIVARAGGLPLTVTAFAVYGINNTDLVLSQEAARRLLASEENRALLREGRIVVIID